jgi:thioredoxin reductase
MHRLRRGLAAWDRRFASRHAWVQRLASGNMFSPPEPPALAPALDVIIVGGGPAGLSAALVLGRCLRRVLVCDAGNPRNQAAKIFNGYLSRDGSSPAEFLAISRAELARYRETVELRRVPVTEIQRGENRFTATLETGEQFTARMLLLASGLADELPEIENLREFYGQSVHSCPYCDGWEVRSQPLAVAGGSQESADLAIELLLWSKDVILCTNGPLNCDPQTRQTLERLAIRVINTAIIRLEGTDGELTGVRFADGSFLPRQALFFSPAQHQRSPFAEQLGLDVCEQDHCIQCEDGCTATNVPGVYAAGNCSRGIQLVIGAVAEGMQAAFAINNALLEADSASGALKDAAAAIGRAPD